MIARLLLAAALLACAAVSVAGTLAPVYPLADLPNHFRPFALAGAGVVLAAALALRAQRQAWAGAALVGLNAILLMLPLLWSAEPAERPAVGQALASAGERDLKIVTFNTAFGDPKAVARYLLREDADIVVLQEVGASQVAALRALLQARYPHVHACTVRHRCAAAILAKRAWVAAGQEHWTSEVPETVWVTFNDPDIGRLRVIGVHLHLPFRPEQQTRQVDRLIATYSALSEPVILAGDFNMTPWSYRLQRLLASTGLRRHATFLRSWPTEHHPRFRPPAPAFLIDHVLTTPGIRSVSIRTGPVVGSDHLPVVARLRLPPA
jgi:endonuclease/exonuclease/phosphatase (EEP) superfamily protein YafD